MDLEQAMNLFGGSDEEQDEQHNNNNNHHSDEEQDDKTQCPSSSSSSSGRSSSSSSGGSSSSSASSSASLSNSTSRSSHDNDDNNNGEIEVRSSININNNYINKYDDNDAGRGYYEEDKDLFGSDNEDYVKTLAKSPYPVPVLPLPIVNNNTRGGFGRGRGGRGRGQWQNDRGGPGLLPIPHGGRNHNFGQRHFNAPRDERLVSELKVNKSEETLARKNPPFQEPCELACYSRVEGGDVYFDDRSLRLFKRLITEDIGTDLNEGFDTFSPKKDLGSQGFGDLLACIRNKNIPLQNMHFVTYRNNLNKIMATAYMRHEPWEMGIHKRKGVVYLDVHKLPERPQSELDRRRCYWGYCFETLATEDPTRTDGEAIHHVDANVEYCAVVKTKLGAHRILMGAEMDCCDSHDDGRRFYVELKTSRELDYHTEERYEREKLLKFWIQSFLAGVPFIVVGYRDDSGRLVRTERLRTKEIAHRIKMKNYWQGAVCLAFADEVLCWLYGTVKDDEDYILQFAHPFTRLELLKAPNTCPEVITQHVQQL